MAGAELEFESELPEDLADLLQSLADR